MGSSSSHSSSPAALLPAIRFDPFADAVRLSDRDLPSSAETLNKLPIIDCASAKGALGDRCAERLSPTQVGINLRDQIREHEGEYMGYCPFVYRAITHSTPKATLRDIRAMSLKIIQQRVRERLDATGISMKAASKEVGGETLVRDLLERDREPSATRLQKLAEVLGCTLAYLTGETDALDEGAAASSFDLVSINEHDVRLSAGPGMHIEAEDVRGVWRAPRSFVQNEVGVNPTALTMVQVHGDSMEPTLRSGDRVVIDHSDTNPARPGIYAIWDGNATVVKRLERVPYSDPPMVVLISDNPNHNPYTVNAELVQVIGRVVMYVRRT